MAFSYEQVVPWGRSYPEYLRMFDLRPAEQELRILGCGDGPASFNREMARRGKSVVSIDPLYALSTEQIEARIEETYRDVIEQTRKEQHRFVWDAIPSVDELGRVRMRAMRAFLDDYEAGRREGRYVSGELPELPVESGSFDLALCSHLLFFYAEQLSLDFHRDALVELGRVAREIRIFPVVDVNGERSPHLEPMLDELGQRGVRAELVCVPYEFQRGGNQMLRIVTGSPASGL